MTRRTRIGFTLVEMLVVITIIGVLVALLIPTIAGVMRRTRNAAIAVELQDLAKAVEAYKAAANDYPPDFTNVAAVSAHMARGYVRNTRNINAWWTSTDTLPNNTTRTYSNLDPAETLFIWLSQLSTNPRDPLGGISSNYAGERKVFFPFDSTRLVDLDQDGWLEYVPRYGNQAPYVYFDGRVLSGEYAYRTALYPKNTPAVPSTVGRARPYRSNTDVVPVRDNNRTQPYNSPLNYNKQQWLNPGGFQLVCAGQDNEFGADNLVSNSVVFKTYPVPNYTIIGTDEDNICNFSDMSTLGDKVP
jgi:prepilin-type N-terminal cleavage/methylation domain-containing protein